MTAFYEHISDAPPVYDEARAADILSTLAKAMGEDPRLAPAAKLLADNQRVRTLLAGTFSASSYLAALASRDPSLLAHCLCRDPDGHFAEARVDLATAMTEAQAANQRGHESSFVGRRALTA